MQISAINLEESLSEEIDALAKELNAKVAPVKGSDEPTPGENAVIFFLNESGEDELSTVIQKRANSKTPILVLSNKQLEAPVAHVHSLTLPLNRDELKKKLISAHSAPDLSFINPVAKSTQSVLKTMAQISEIKKKRVFVTEKDRALGDISGVIGISGPARGNIAISLSSSLATKIVEQMLGLQASDIDEESLHDGIGEVINMIAGQAKAELSVDGKSTFQLSLPTVISGANHRLHQKSGAKSIVIEFEADGEAFYLHVSLI